MSETGKSDNSAFYLRILVLLVLMALAGAGGLWLGKQSVPEETPALPKSAEELPMTPPGKLTLDAPIPTADPTAPPVYFYAHPQNEDAWKTVLEEVAMASEAPIMAAVISSAVARSTRKPLRWARSTHTCIGSVKRILEPRSRSAMANSPV